MKRLLWISFSIVLFLSGISFIKADTILEPTSNTNGNVEIKLNFEEGYVGAIDLTLKVSSNVKVTAVNWNTSLSNSYTKRYTYDEINHVVKIYLATGNNTKNLVDKNGILNVGSLTVKSVSGESANYTVDIASLSYVDANYTSIAKNDLKIGGNNQFTYQVTNDNNNPSDVEKPSTNKPNQTKPNQSKPNQSTSKEDLEKDPTTEEKPDEQKPADKNDKDDEEDNKKDDDNKVDNDKKPEDNKQPEELEKSEAKKNFDWKMLLGIVVIAMLLITLISMITKKFKD